jgi:integrase
MNETNTKARRAGKALSEAAIKRLKGEAARREIADIIPGLYLIVQAKTGAKSWALRYRDAETKKSVKLWLGWYDGGDETVERPKQGRALTLLAARALANDLQRQRKRGIDPVAEKRREETAAVDEKANAFGPLARRYVEAMRDAGQRRWRVNARLLGLLYPTSGSGEPLVRKGGLAEQWASKPVRDIDADIIERVIDQATTDGVPGTRGRQKERRTVPTGRAMHGALSPFFRWAKKRRKITVNPCADVERPKAPEARERVLSDLEIAAVWDGCDQLAPHYRGMVRFMLLTGCRLREASGLRWSEISADGVWTLPRARSKNKLALILPLPKAALDLLAEAPRIDGGDFVFTVSGRQPIEGFGPMKRNLDAASGVTGWVLHDCRRTLATNLQRLGVRLEVTEAVLNHVGGSRGGIVGVYQRHDWFEEKRQALEAWSKKLAALVGGEEAASNVRSLAARRA